MAFYHNWAGFVEENKEHIAKITSSTYSDLPVKIQAISARVANEYCAEDRFYVPRDLILDTNNIKYSIMRQTFSYTLPPTIKKSFTHPYVSNIGAEEEEEERGWETPYPSLASSHSTVKVRTYGWREGSRQT